MTAKDEDIMKFYEEWNCLSQNEYHKYHHMDKDQKYELLKKFLCNIQTIGSYDSNSTPFELFDQPCHDEFLGKKTGNGWESEEDLIFMINCAEHVNKPDDMLMFLGEYFKEHISNCMMV